MVAAGYGVSIIPESLSRLHLKGVVYLPIKGGRPEAPIKLAHRLDERSPVVRNLVSIVRRLSAPSIAQAKPA
jgi:DNA-binding transcriptional LysR family regulator